MIKGLDKFKTHFAQHTKSFILIGGVACHEWLAAQGLEFRATRDIDIVLIVEALDQEFIARFWEFVEVIVVFGSGQNSDWCLSWPVESSIHPTAILQSTDRQFFP
jgi:hypothetical protein